MSDLGDRLKRLRADALARLAAANDVAEIEALRSTLLGRSGDLTVLLRGLSAIDPADRPALGSTANAVRHDLEDALASRFSSLQADALADKLGQIGVL